MLPLSDPRSRAQESSAAIQRLYIAMRHLFIRGNYKPLGASGEAMIEALRVLRPEIYGTINDPEKVELKGLLYVFQRLPIGIEECRFVKLISREGYEKSNFEPLVPSKRRRNCFRTDDEQMLIEMTRGRSDIYDVLTHLTFMYVESEKIRRNSTDSKNRVKREWILLQEIVEKEQANQEIIIEQAYTYLSMILGRTFQETAEACAQFEAADRVNSLFHITYWLGRLSFEELTMERPREITFSSALREKVGHHTYGEQWAFNIKAFLVEKGLADRPIHLISSNLHSVMNILYAKEALKSKVKSTDFQEVALQLSVDTGRSLREQVEKFALRNGMYFLEDDSGTNISVQIFDLVKVCNMQRPHELDWQEAYIRQEQPVLLVMDYAFGEQAFETLDELLKPIQEQPKRINLPIESISIMGKAGTLKGKKGDILIPSAHIFEGSADNYPFDNAFKVEDFLGNGLDVHEGSMITVLGTSLQNREILRFFLESSWNAVGLEMEGAHYQKAIQAASKIRRNIRRDITLRYAYYASDNPLISGQTLASGSLGREGVKPTYLITFKILNQILGIRKK